MLRRHLSYANVTATLALVLAAGTGGAWAAGELLTGKDVKNASLTGADLRKGSVGIDRLRPAEVAKLRGPGVVGASGAIGPSGSAGPAGPAGPAGAPGAAGRDGANGKDGAAGTPGAAGASAFAPLPSGQTITGGTGIEAPSVPAGQPLLITVPLGAVARDRMNLRLGPKGANGQSVTPVLADTPTDPVRCAGTYESPTAAPGFLCLYVAFSDGAAPNSIDVTPLAGGSSPLDLRAFQVIAGRTSGSAGRVFAPMSFAYTAP